MAMPSEYTDQPTKTSKTFWKNYSGKKTLHEVVKQFIIDGSTDQRGREDFIVNVIGRDLIQKTLDRRKLFEIVEQEISKINPTELKTEEKTTSKKSDGKWTIFNVDRLNGYQFEDFMGKVLTANGFSDVQVTKKSGEQGADIIAKKDGEKIVFQAKNNSLDNSVGNKAVQEVLGARGFYDANKGVVVTNVFFTRSAKDLAKATNIELWNRDTVTELLKGFNRQGKWEYEL